MKKVLLLLVLFISISKINAQKDSVSISAGLMFVPQGTISLKNPEKGFSTFAAGFLVAQISYKKTTYTPFYNMTGNATGIAIYQSFTNNFGSYVVGTKSILKEGGYVGIGLGTPVAAGRATFFVECGSPWNTWDPGIYIGAFIPLTKKLK